MLDQGAPIFVAGHRGLVGSAIAANLAERGHTRIVKRTKAELNLLDQDAVNRFFREQNLSYVVVAAARVGGIYANSTYPADFLYENLLIAANVIHASFETKVEKLLFLGSSCIYPRMAPQPIPESALLSGPLEKTNDAYALAKIAGLKLCETYHRQYGCRFISAMPTNLYGPNDNFHPLDSHVIPGMLRRFHDAKEQGLESVTVWGTGTPRREFLHVDDLADALYLLMERYEEAQTINVGSGMEYTIAELAAMMKRVVGYEGEIRFDPSKPDGTPRKLLDSSRLQAMGWKPRISLEEGLRATYQSALERGIFDSATVKA